MTHRTATPTGAGAADIGQAAGQVVDHGDKAAGRTGALVTDLQGVDPLFTHLEVVRVALVDQQFG